MATWIDIFSLVVTTLFFFGSIYGVLYAARAISSRCQSVKASLENEGITISREGVSLKTLKRFDRETYVDATQRGLVKALGAATVGPETHKRAFLPHSQSSMDATPSGTDMRTGRGHGKLPFGLHRSRGDQHADAEVH